MFKTIIAGLALFTCINLFAASTDKPVKPVGFFVNNFSEAGADDSVTPSHAKFIRDGKEFDAIEGNEVLPGDVVVTDASGGIQIAFLDNSAVRLHESTEFVIQSSTNGQLPGVQLSYGHASFAASPTAPQEKTDLKHSNLFMVGDGIINLINLGVGKHGAVSASTAAKFDIIVTRDANGTTFTATVAVIKGTATLTPVGTNAVNLAFGSQALLKITNPVAGVTNSPVTLNQGNLTQDQIIALANKSVADTTVSVSTNGTVTINSVIRNPDGSVSVGKVTEIHGLLSKDSWTTKDANNKTIATWTESKTGITMSRVYDGYTLKSTVKKPAGTGTGTFKGPNGNSYKGTSIIDPKSGAVTFKSTAPSKDGSTASYSYDPTLGSQTVTIVSKTGTATQTIQSYSKSTGIQTTTSQTGTFINGVFVVDPSSVTTVIKNIGTSATGGVTPDGRTIDQNQPPITQ